MKELRIGLIPYEGYVGNLFPRFGPNKVKRIKKEEKKNVLFIQNYAMA